MCESTENFGDPEKIRVVFVTKIESVQFIHEIEWSENFKWEQFNEVGVAFTRG